MYDSSNANKITFSNPVTNAFSSGIKRVNVQYDATLGYPFKTKTIMTPDPWLIYNRYNEDANSSSFVLEFFNSNPSWSGTTNNTGTVDSNASKTTNRRINW
jgi:hypothetical protein